MTPPDAPMTPERRVTVDFDPIRWHGSPILTWLLAGVAWGWAILLGLLLIVGAGS